MNKFRVRDGEKMIEESNVQKYGVSLFLSLEGELVDVANERFDKYDYKVMQRTGLTDKNGKEIYEGDILKFGLGKSNETGYDHGYAIGDVEYKCPSYEINHPEGYHGKFALSNDMYHGMVRFEVIGNIYQDKHLLDDH